MTNTLSCLFTDIFHMPSISDVCKLWYCVCIWKNALDCRLQSLLKVYMWRGYSLNKDRKWILHGNEMEVIIVAPLTAFWCKTSYLYCPLKDLSLYTTMGLGFLIITHTLSTFMITFTLLCFYSFCYLLIFHIHTFLYKHALHILWCVQNSHELKGLP